MSIIIMLSMTFFGLKMLFQWFGRNIIRFLSERPNSVFHNF